MRLRRLIFIGAVTATAALAVAAALPAPTSLRVVDQRSTQRHCDRTTYTVTRTMLDHSAPPETQTRTSYDCNPLRPVGASFTSWRIDWRNYRPVGYALFDSYFSRGKDCFWFGACAWELGYRQQFTALWNANRCAVGMEFGVNYGPYNGGGFWSRGGQGIWPRIFNYHWDTRVCNQLDMYQDSLQYDGGSNIFTSHVYMGAQQLVTEDGILQWRGMSDGF